MAPKTFKGALAGRKPPMVVTYDVRIHVWPPWGPNVRGQVTTVSPFCLAVVD